MELRLSGLVVKQQGQLRVYNRIYQAVFNNSWMEKELAALRPYSQAIAAWEASNRQDSSRLLQGLALQEAFEWKAGKSLSVEDDDFLATSQQLAILQMQTELEAERQALAILASAKQQAEQMLEEAKEGTQLEWAGVRALQLFEAGGREIEALLAAMQAGLALHNQVRDGRSLLNYPASSPLLTLQVILDNIRERNRFLGHKSGVNSVSFSPNGEYVATASSDRTARLWNLSGKQIARFKGHQGKVWSVCFSPNGEYIATASSDRTARLWNLSGKKIATFKGHQDEVWSVHFSPNSEHIATASSDGTARLWDLSGSQITVLKGYQSGLRSISFSPNGKYLAIASGDGTARVGDLSGYQLTQLKGHQSRINSVIFSSNGEYIATSSTDGTTRLWNLFGYQLAELKEHQSRINSASFSPDSKYIATASSEGIATLWDLSGHQVQVTAPQSFGT